VTDDLHAQLADCITQIIPVVRQLQMAMLRTSVPAGTGVRVHAGTGSRPPWNGAAALTVLELHALVRALEKELRDARGLSARLRGSSDANTEAALNAIPDLLTALPVPEGARVLRVLTRWLRGARTVLGDLELPRRLPRVKGAGEPRCPFCTFQTLRMWALEGIVRCLNPVCTDAEGRHPVARMEFSSFTGELELIWQDGGVGLS
jgi:hypothetical protein